MNVERDGFLISTEPARLDLDAVERLLRGSYWAAERSRNSIERSVRHALCFGLYEIASGRQIGLTRVVTDYVTFAWICDVVIEEKYRGKGLGTWMMESLFSCPEIRDVGRWILATRDAHGLYERYGFTPMARPDRWMERIRSKTDCTQQ
ncbi:MAG: GNAT family N-acetyltransferase [Candidatus Baltobacteraceae bacterium]